MRDIVEHARTLCDEIAGELPEEESRGSIEIVTVLVAEVVRLREQVKYGTIFGHETRYPEKVVPYGYEPTWWHSFIEKLRGKP